jgi:hypothetical protein
MTAIKALAEFIKQDRFPHNCWLSGSDMQVYVRKSMRFLDGKQYVMLDIGNVEVRKKGKGKFTKFLQEAEGLNPWHGVYVENVFMPRFQVFFLKQGYIQATKEFAPSFYKMKD